MSAAPRHTGGMIAVRCPAPAREVAVRCLLMFLGLAVGLWVYGCTQSALPQTVIKPTNLPVPDGWHDGSYTGVSDRVGDLPTPQLVRVAVDIFDGRIVTLRIHQPPGWQAPPRPELLLRRLLQQQTTELETPPPVSNESDQLLRALGDALSRARLASPTTQ